MEARSRDTLNMWMPEEVVSLAITGMWKSKLPFLPMWHPPSLFQSNSDRGQWNWIPSTHSVHELLSNDSPSTQITPDYSSILLVKLLCFKIFLPHFIHQLSLFLWATCLPLWESRDVPSNPKKGYIQDTAQPTTFMTDFSLTESMRHTQKNTFRSWNILFMRNKQYELNDWGFLRFQFRNT